MFHSMRIQFPNGNVQPFPSMKEFQALLAWVQEESEKLSKKGIQHTIQRYHFGTNFWVDQEDWSKVFRT